MDDELQEQWEAERRRTAVWTAIAVFACVSVATLLWLASAKQSWKAKRTLSQHCGFPKIAEVASLAELGRYPRLCRYRDYLIAAEAEKYCYRLIRFQDFEFDTDPFEFLVGPGKDIDAIFAFLVCKDKQGMRRIEILQAYRSGDGSDDVIVVVPQTRAGAYVLLVARLCRDVRLNVREGRSTER